MNTRSTKRKASNSDFLSSANGSKGSSAQKTLKTKTTSTKTASSSSSLSSSSVKEKEKEKNDDELTIQLKVRVGKLRNLNGHLDAHYDR